MTLAASGYAHPAYAASLAAYGAPHWLSACGGSILIRPIPASNLSDAMGCYPIFACREWQALPDDLAALSTPLISLTLVADPFGNHSLPLLRASFPDHLIPFKTHFAIDLTAPWPAFVAPHHRRNAHKALETLHVEHSDAPLTWLDEWTTLYAHLIERHAIRGLTRFSRSAFAAQLTTPGIQAFRARVGAETVGMALWYVQGEVGYYHLAAYSPTGYALRASFALFWQAIPFLQNLPGVRWLSLGAGAGLQESATDGLTRFKRGWSTHTRTAYLCGRIFDPTAYARLTAAHAAEPATTYFPAYRVGEW